MRVSFDFDSLFNDIENRIKQLKEENQMLKNKQVNSLGVEELRVELEQKKNENSELKVKFGEYEEKLTSLHKQLSEIIPSASPAHGFNQEAKINASLTAKDSASSSVPPIPEDKTIEVEQPVRHNEQIEKDDQSDEKIDPSNLDPQIEQGSEGKEDDQENQGKNDSPIFDHNEKDPFEDEEDPFSTDDELEDDDSDFFKNVVSNNEKE